MVMRAASFVIASVQSARLTFMVNTIINMQNPCQFGIFAAITKTGASNSASLCGLPRGFRVCPVTGSSRGIDRFQLRH